jgi:hypothetical protein
MFWLVTKFNQRGCARSRPRKGCGMNPGRIYFPSGIACLTVIITDPVHGSLCLRANLCWINGIAIDKTTKSSSLSGWPYVQSEPSARTARTHDHHTSRSLCARQMGPRLAPDVHPGKGVFEPRLRRIKDKLLRVSRLALADYFLDHHDEKEPSSVPTARPEHTPSVDIVSHYR